MPPRPGPLTGRPARQRAGRLLGTLTLAAAFLLVGVPAAAAAPPPAPAPAAPDHQRVPARYLPSPSPDPWYSTPPRVDPGTPHGEILDTRPVTIPPYNALGVGRAWQVLVQSSDSHDRPQQIISTIIEPAAPWTGPGPRPLLSFNATINSLGLTCMPSYVLTHGFNLELPPFLQIFINRGYGLVVTDFEGPKAAYAAGRANGRAVLDGIRAARAFVPPGGDAAAPGGNRALFGDSRVVQFGYSGGGIATGWAAQLQPVYAPELTDVLVGSSIGGVPADYSTLFPTMDGTVASGLFRGAILGLAREYPELYSLLNDTGDLVAHHSRDLCAAANTAAGLFPIPLSAITDVDPLTDPTVQRILARNRLGAADPAAGADPREVPTGPVQIWHGDAAAPFVTGSGTVPSPGDLFVPAHAARRLADEWCAAGADVEYTPVAGEHITAPFTGLGPALDWVDDRARGVPFTGGCR